MTFPGNSRSNSGATVVQRVGEEDAGDKCHVDHAQRLLLYLVFVKNAHITSVRATEKEENSKR